MDKAREAARKELVRLVRHVLGGQGGRGVQGDQREQGDQAGQGDQREQGTGQVRAKPADLAQAPIFPGRETGVSSAKVFQATVTGDKASVARSDGTVRDFSAAALAAGASLGLFSWISGTGRWRILPPAVGFLKRAMIEPETAFAGQHRVLGETVAQMPDGPQAATINLAESPLATIARLKEKSGAAFLPPEALEAGQRLHRDFTRAQLQPRLTMRFEPRLSNRTKGEAGGAGDLSDTALAARLRVARAMEAIGPELCGVAIDVCGFEKGLETVERERQWPVRSAKLMLRAALMALARHYAPPAPVSRRSHAWGSEGYRPGEAERGR